MKSVIQTAKNFLTGITDRKLSIYATSGCYYMFMSLVPFVMVICCILPYTPFDLKTVLANIELYFSKELVDIITKIVYAIYSSNATTITVSIFLTLFSASASMKALMRGLNTAYQIKEKDNFIIFNLKAIIYMIILIIAMLCSLIIMVYGGKILELIQAYLPHIYVFNFILSNARYLMVMCLLIVIFMMFYTLIPARKMHWQQQIPGAIFTSVIWVIFSYVFTIYVNMSNKFGAYGYIGTMMVAMMWIYWCFFFMLIGGYLNSFLQENK